MARKKSLSTFELIFIGEFVEVVSNLIGGQGEHGLPLILSGYLMDLDEQYLYMSETPDHIEQAVRRDSVVFIKIVEEFDELKEALKSVPTPRNKDEGN